MQHYGIVQPLQLVKLVASALLVAWLAASAVQFSQHFAPEPVSGVAAVKAERKAQRSRPSLPDVNIANLKSIALFGEVVEIPPETVAVEAPKEEKLVETKLNLTLKGLFTSETEGLGRAIIANGRAEQLYQIDDEIEGLSNVKLTAVFFDHIRINNRGTAEALYLYPEGERPVASNAVSDFVSNEPALAGTLETEEPSADPTAAENTKKLNQIMRVVRERDKETGEMLGFRVLPGRDREAFERSGLKVNDVITSIDGEQLTDLRSAMNIYRSKRDATQVSLVVRRSDNEISLDLDLSKLNI